MWIPSVAGFRSYAVLCLALSISVVRVEPVRAQYDATPAAAAVGRLAQTHTSVPPRPNVTADSRAAEVRARLSFALFTRVWMEKLIATEQFQRARQLTITETADGFVAEYTGYLPHRYTTVKATASPVTPFIGILSYYKKTMRSVGETKQQAMRGPFEQAGTSQVAEIFRYTAGEWVY